MASSTASSPSSPRRWLWAAVLVFGLAWIGLAAGTFLGGRFLVPAGSGLAGPAIALGYGVLAAGLGALVAGLVSWKAAPGFLRAAAVGSTVLGLLVAAAVGWRILDQRSRQRAERGLDVPLPAPAAFVLEAGISEQDGMRSFRELVIDGGAWTFRYVAVGPGAPVCTGKLTGDEAALLLRRLRALEERLDQSPSPCSEDRDPPFYTFSWRPEPSAGRAAETAEPWKVEASPACLRTENELAEVSLSLRRIPLDAVSHGRVSCG